MPRRLEAYPAALRELIDLAAIGANESLDRDSYPNFETARDAVLKIYDTLIHTLGLAGEAGEIADEVKKVLGHGKAFNREKFVEERGDLNWYYEAVGEDLGIAEGESEASNEEKLRARYPQGFVTHEQREDLQSVARSGVIHTDANGTPIE